MRPDLESDLIRLTLEHMEIVLLALGFAIAAGVPVGILLARLRSARGWVLGVINTVQTIPSLALFGFLIPVPLIGGIGRQTAVVALALYALLPIVRNTLTGILNVDPAVRESAVAMGLSARQLLLLVELPLAASSIVTGIRVATVSTVGTATIAAAIGGGGLGVFIFRGVASVDTAQILAGAIPSAGIALLADWGIGWFEKRYAQRA